MPQPVQYLTGSTRCPQIRIYPIPLAGRAGQTVLPVDGTILRPVGRTTQLQGIFSRNDILTMADRLLIIVPVCIVAVFIYLRII